MIIFKDGRFDKIFEDTLDNVYKEYENGDITYDEATKIIDEPEKVDKATKKYEDFILNASDDL